MSKIINFVKQYVLCCCFKKKKYTFICTEGNLEEELNNSINSPLLTEETHESKIFTKKNFKYNSRYSLSNIVIEGNDLVIKKSENPSNNYEKEAELGQGSFGKVYKVRHYSTGVTRALKVINRNDSEESDISKEGEVMKSLSHPNIIKIFEVYCYNNNVFLVEEYIKGGDLYSKISKMDHFSEKITLVIMKQIFSAVHYLHTNNIIHGDLKLENIMIHSLDIRKKPTMLLSNDKSINDFDIKIIDFGCSTLFFKNKPLTELIGTIFYLAPEVIYGSYDNRCDIWSCGVIMYVLITGKFPFDGESTEEIFDKIKKGKYYLKHKEFSYVSKDTIDLLQQCLEKNPYNRISAEKALGHRCFNKLPKKDSIRYSHINDLTNQRSSHDLYMALENIKLLSKKVVFQKAVIKYITYNLFNQEEMNYLRSLYKTFDKNNDGYLTVEELIEGFKKAGIIINKEEVELIAKSLANNNEVIEYEDFITVFVDKNKILEDKNLRIAFDLFDIDKSGAISIDEIKSIFKLNKKFNDKITEDIINQLDLKSQHEITYDEFSKLIKESYS